MKRTFILCLTVLAAVFAAISCTKDVDYSVVTDLSEPGTANCYVINKAGEYTFNALVKGNGQGPNATLPYTPNDLHVDVLWESYGNGISPKMGTIIQDDPEYLYIDNNGYAHFRTANPMKDGNAVLGLYVYEGGSIKYVWSWHIWVCKGFNPERTKQTYKSGDIMMDRNLGATSNRAGDVRSLGLLYQFGRKDPFLSGRSIYSKDKPAESNHNPFPSPISTEPNPIPEDYIMSHPMTFVFGGRRVEGSTLLWDDAGQKTIQDPCPSGWRVPEGGRNGVWSKSFGKIDLFPDNDTYWEGEGDWDIVNRGVNFGKSTYTLGSGTIWYPCAGAIYSTTGKLMEVGQSGLYWTRTLDDQRSAYCMILGNSGLVAPFRPNDLTEGMSVRCQKEVF